MRNTVYILGAGSGYPQQEITNAFLTGLRPDLTLSSILEKTGIYSRYSVLPLDYLRNGGNSDIRNALQVVKEGPTTIGLSAVEVALARAGIEKEKIGLIIADTLTPRQTTPSEAQRVGGALGLKIPAYDTSAPSASFNLFLELISKWRDERIPDYVLCVSTSTPTERVDYSSGDECLYIGDAAAAIVVSTRIPGKFKVKDLTFEQDHKVPSTVSINTLGPLQINENFSSDFLIKSNFDLLTRACKKNSLKASQIKYLPPQFNSKISNDLSAQFSLDKSQVITNFSKRGFNFSAGQMAAFADAWDSFKSGDKLVQSCAGFGANSGYLLVEA